MLVIASLTAAALSVAPSSDVPLLPFPLAPAGGDRLALDDAAHAALRGVTQARLVGAPFPGLEGAVLEVERAPLATRDGVLAIDGEVVGRGPEALLGGLTLWSGRVAGEPDSRVFLALSENGSRGWVRAGGELVHLLAEPGPLGWADARSRFATDASLRALAGGQDFRCDALAPPYPVELNPSSARAVDPTPPGALAGTAPTPLYELRVALETDFQFYEVFGDAGAAATYALSLFGAVSDAYRRDVDLVVTVPYLGLYTSNTDPWDAQDQGLGSLEALYEFRDEWKVTGWPADADLAHLISGAGLGGGIAYLDVLCVADYGYAVSGNLHGATPFPVAQGPLNWDFVVTAHETGHNVATTHTHNYCPPIDECAPDGYFGDCQDEELCVEGTIMSYCHLCNELGIGNVKPEFHPIVRDVLRGRIEDSCLRPFDGVFTTDLGNALPGAGPATELTFAWADAPGPGGAVVASVADAPTMQVGALVLGGSRIDLPLFGGVLVPAIDLLHVFASTAPDAQVSSLPVAGGFPGGAPAWAQTWFVDPFLEDSYTASNAVELEVHAPDAPPALAWIAHPSNGLEYAVGPPKTWLAGRGLAQQYGGDLASLDSAALEAWLKATFFDAGLASGSVYIGYTDEFSEGSFHWSDGATGSHSNWAANEPNDYDGFEDHAEWLGGGQWNDVTGFDSRPALYQRPAGSQP